MGESLDIQCRPRRRFQRDTKFGKPALYRLDDAVQMLHVIIDMHVIAPLYKLLDHARQEHIAERAGRQNAQMASLRIPKIRKPLQQTFCHGLQWLDILIDRLALGRRDQPVTNAVE